MQKFHFALESVLKLRETQLELQQAALQNLYAELQTLDKEQTELGLEKSHADSAVKTQSSNMALSLFALDTFNRHVDRLQSALESRKVDCLGRLAVQRERTIVARREHELLVRLKENNHREWQRSFDREQEQVASELYLAKWAQEQHVTSNG